ncbi:MAG: phenylacetate--CoA ligase family protein, partial [Anaerolineales bacterium]
AVEAFKIGFTCEERTGFHLHEDLTYVKIVDSSGRRLPPDEKGEVIISNLVNRGTVLLNYRLGDIAALSHEPCPCGRTFVMLSDLEGRVEDILHLPDGSFVHPRLVWKLFKHRTGVLRYQLIQHALDTFELRLTTIDRSAFDRVIGEVIADLRQLLGQDAIIDAVYQAEFQPYTGAKFRPVLSLLKDGRELDT